MGKVFQAVALDAQRVGNVHSRSWIEFENVIVSEGDAIQGSLRPDNLHGSGTWRRGSFTLGELHEPFANPAMLDKAARRIRRLSLGIKASFMRRVRLQIEYRLCLNVGHRYLPLILKHSTILGHCTKGDGKMVSRAKSPPRGHGCSTFSAKNHAKSQDLFTPPGPHAAIAASDAERCRITQALSRPPA
jgi:hypothetical protein